MSSKEDQRKPPLVPKISKFVVFPATVYYGGPRPTSPLDPFGLSKPVWTTDHIPLSSMLDLWYLFVFPMYRWRIRTARPTSYQIPPEMLILPDFSFPDALCMAYLPTFWAVLGGKCRQLISHHTFWASGFGERMGTWYANPLTLRSLALCSDRSFLDCRNSGGLKNWWFNLVKAITQNWKKPWNSTCRGEKRTSSNS